MTIKYKSTKGKMYTMKLEKHIILFLLSVFMLFTNKTYHRLFVNGSLCRHKGSDVILLKDYLSKYYLFQNDIYIVPSYIVKDSVPPFWISKFIQDTVEGISSHYAGGKASLPRTIMKQYIDFYKKIRVNDVLTIIGTVTQRNAYGEIINIFGIKRNGYVPSIQNENMCDELKQYNLSIALNGKNLYNIMQNCVLYFLVTLEVKGGSTFKETSYVSSRDNVVPRKILEGYVHKLCDLSSKK